jgi:hypothetical protein
MQLARLAERDGWWCWLCGGAIDPALGDGPWRATVDHLVPRSRGGTSQLDNLRLAHRRCNNRRGSHLPELEWPTSWQLLVSAPLWPALSRLAPRPGAKEVVAVSALEDRATVASSWVVERAEELVPGGWESSVDRSTGGPVSVWLRRPTGAAPGSAGRPRHPDPA